MEGREAHLLTAYSTTTSSSNPMSFVTSLTIHGRITERLTLRMSTFCENSAGNLVVRRSLASLSENRLSWSIWESGMNARKS